MVKMEDQQKQRLIIATKMEYVGPIVGKKLLRKFPDNSALGFEYSQSSIWSPLVPRIYSPMDLDLVTPRKLSYGFGMGLETQSGVKKVSSNLKKKIKTTSFGINFNLLRKSKKMKKKSKNTSDFSPIRPASKASCTPISAKGWTKMLRAATKHFKKKKKDATIHIKLSNY